MAIASQPPGRARRSSRPRGRGPTWSGAAPLQPGQWLLTLGGWHEEQCAGDRRELTLAELDAVAGDRPAFIQAQYDHAPAADEIKDIAPLATMVGGRVVHGSIASLLPCQHENPAE
jgi:predicted amidohydrolase YtcJ